MIHFTLKDLEEFLKSLPPEHEFNMFQNEDMDPDTCGCLLLQYGRHVFKDRGLSGLSCGFHTIGQKVNGENHLDAIGIDAVDDFIRECFNASAIHKYIITASQALVLLSKYNQ